MKIQRLEDVTSFPEPRELSEEEIKQAYALAREAFTADDLQRYTELDKGISADEVLTLMEETQQQIDQRNG